MPRSTEMVLNFISTNTDRLLLLLPLAIAFGLGWAGWRQRQSQAARGVAQAAGILLVGLLVWLTVAAPMAARAIDPALWGPPLDRLLAVTFVIALAWLWVKPAPPRAQRWRFFLATGFALTLLAYLIWAPAWANAWRDNPLGAAGTRVVGLRRVWDLWFLIMAALLVALLAKSPPRAPRWHIAAAVCLAAGGLIEVVAALSGTYLPVWSRLGLFAAGICVIGAGVRLAIESPREEAAPTQATAASLPVAIPAAGSKDLPAVGSEAIPADGPDEDGDLRLAVARLTARVARIEEGPLERPNGGETGSTIEGAVGAPSNGSPPQGSAGAAISASNGAQTARQADGPETVAVTAPEIDVRPLHPPRPPSPPETPRPVEPGARVHVALALIPEISEALQAPMNKIQSYRDLLARGGGLRDEQVSRYLHRIDANLVRLQVMLDTLVTLLALGSPALPGASSTISEAPSVTIPVAPVLRTALDRAAPELQEKGLAVRLAIDEPLHSAAVDPESLARIVDNLLVNASRRSPQGGEITLDARQASEPGSGDGLLISMHDWGARVGDASAGGSEIDPTDDPDAALDLKVIRLFAEQLGGRFWVENRAAGAGFFVSLPGDPVRRA